MVTASVDLSSGLVPKQPDPGLDLSAGFVPKQQASSPPGFFKRLGQSVGAPTSAEELQAAQPSTAEMIGGPAVTAGKMLLNYGKTAVKGIVEGGKEAYDAGRNIGEGGPVLPNVGKAASGLVHASLQATPVIGPAIETAGQDVTAKNYSGAAGGLTGVIGQLALASDPGQAAAEKTTAMVKSAPGAIADAARQVYGVAKPEALSATESATKALKPRNSKVNWNQDVGSALPDVRRAVDNAGIDPNSATLDDVERATLQAKKDVWSEYQGNFTGPNKAAAVDASPVAKTIRGTVSQRTLEQNPSLADHVEAIARTYDGRQLSVSDLEDRIGELNRETRGIEARYPADKAAAKDLPENAPTFAERNALKNLLTSKLDEVAGPGAQDLRNRYGALSSFQDVLQRRKTVYERADPESLGEQVGRFEGAGQIVRGATKIVTGNPLAALSGAADIAGGVATRAASKAGRQINDSQFLLRQALRKTTPRPAMVPRVSGEYMQPAPPSQLPGIAGFLPRGQYEAPASPVPPQGQLPMPVTEGEYMPEPPAPRARVAGFLPRGVYEQSGGFEPNQPALPPYKGIQLPAKGRKPPVSRSTRAQGEMR